MEQKIWNIFRNRQNPHLEGRLFYSVLLLSAGALFLLGLFLLNWPHPEVSYGLLGLSLFMAFLHFSQRWSVPMGLVQSLYFTACLSVSWYIFEYSGGLEGPVLFGILLSFLALLTTTTQIWQHRLIFLAYSLYGTALIFYRSSANYDLQDQFIFFAIFLFFTLIFYLGTVYLISEYHRVANNFREQRDELERANQRYKEQVQSISELNAQKSRLFSIIGHDLRSPLSGIEGLLHLLAMDQEQSEDQKIMQQDLLRLTRNSRTLLDNLLFWSKRESSAYEPSLIDYQQVIQMVVDYLDPIAKAKQVELQVLIEPHEGKVWNDAQMLEMVIRNLVQNAIKFVKPGGWVKLRAYETERTLLLEVEDNGIGMSEEQATKLFSDQREVRPGTAQEKGVGLGLKLCADFVKQMQGEISLRSQEGKGTCFIIHLPRTKQDSLTA